MQFFYIIEMLLFTIDEYRNITGEMIRLELVQLGGIVMHFISKMSNHMRFASNLPCFANLHCKIFEKLVMCIDYLYNINQRNVLPVSMDTCATPLSSPMGHIVVYSNGLIQCVLESLV